VLVHAAAGGAGSSAVQLAVAAGSRQLQAHLLDLLAAGAIRPIVGRTVPFEGLAEALDDMEARTTVGRVVVTR
jgi:NADPH:quinone reductase-like Zn-dependent oxidoreductase